VTKRGNQYSMQGVAPVMNKIDEDHARERGDRVAHMGIGRETVPTEHGAWVPRLPEVRVNRGLTLPWGERRGEHGSD
jgi:hypothetical protein